MPNVIYTATLDFTDNGVFNAGWRIKQGDFGSSSLNITLSDNGVIFFDDSIEPEIVFKRADGRSVISTMQSAGENSGYYIYNFVGNELAVPGPCVVDVKVNGSDSRTSTASCRFDVVEDTIGYDETGAETYNNPVASLIDIALTKSGEAEAWAVGTRNEQPVGPGDPTFENNSKYYYDEIFEILPKVEDDEPYVLRHSLGKNVSFNIVGGSVAWNQLVQNGNFASTSNWGVSSGGTFTVSGNVATVTATTGGIYQNIGFISNHVYFYGFTIKNTKAMVCGSLVFGGRISVSASNSFVTYQKIGKVTSLSAPSLNFYNGTSESNTFNLQNVNLIDLTLLFGTTIADYIYSLEQATSGSGVAWFRKYFPKQYYAYNKGSIQEVCVSGRKVVGKNLCDPSNMGHNVRDNSTGEITSTSNTISSNTNIIRIKPSTIYTIERDGTKYSTRVFFYDVNKSHISNAVYNGTFTTPNNAYYLAFQSGYVNGALDLWCVVEGDSTEYVPYTTTTYPIPAERLNGIPKLVDNKLQYDGDILESNGKSTYKYSTVNLGGLTWSATSISNVFTASISSIKKGVTNTTSNILCQKYVTTQTKGSVAETVNNLDKVIAVLNGMTNIVVKDADYSDVAAFKTAMAGVYLVYEMDGPIEMQTTPFQMPQKAFPGGTEEFIDGLTRDVMVPVGNNSEYFVDDVVDYSTSEQDTGMKWLNGKKIYQKTLDLGSSGISVPANGTAATSESKTGKEQVIWSSAITTDGKTAPYIGGFVGSTYITMENKTGNATTVRYFTFQYTKS